MMGLNLIPPDPLTRNLLVNVLAAMLRHELERQRLNGQKEAATDSAVYQAGESMAADDAPAEPETPTVGGKD